jgi:hypothetical protein
MTSGSARSALAGRGFLLLPAAAFAVHELRYKLAYGSNANAALSAQGHSYLDSLAPWLVLLLALALGCFLVRVSRALAGRPDRAPRRSFAALWLLATASLAAVYAGQELLEGVFAEGHPSGLAALVAHGGWWALAAAIVLGAAVAGVLRLGSVVVASAGRLAARRPLHALRIVPLRPRSALLAPRGVLASAAAGRAPPLG